MTAPLVEYETQGVIAVIALNRPDRLNALNAELGRDLRAAFDRAEDDHAIRAVVLHGRGRAFCAGADIAEARSVDGVVDALAFLRRVRPIFDRVAAAKIPTIAALHGFAFGGGLELALACDLRVAASGTRVGLPETKIGALPAGGGLARLPRIVGTARAKELVFGGEPICDATALAYGLFNRVVDNDHVAEAVNWAEEIGRQPPVAIALAKRVIDQGASTDFATAYELELLATTIVFGTDDRREGMAAFLEKRDADFGGR